MDISSVVYKRMPARFDMCGQFLGHDLKVTDENISVGLVKRLVKYALERFEENGFNVADYRVEVSTMDADEIPSNRAYAVYFTNSKGGRIGLVRILTRSGWPTLDHGFEIATDQA